jgi:hypothetical protein
MSFLRRFDIRPWAFVLLAIVDVLINTARYNEQPHDLSLNTILSFGLGLIPSIVACLLPAALLVRHPDAWSRGRPLVVGTTLLAVAVVLQLLELPLSPVFQTLTPPADDGLSIVPLSVAYNALYTMVTALGLVDIGLGLTQARRYEDRRSIPTGWIVLAIAGLATAIRFWTVLTLDFTGTPLTPVFLSYIVSFLLLGLITVGSWAYLTVSATGGAIIGESPRVGWRLASAGGWIVLLTFGIITVEGLIQPADENVVGVVVWITSILLAAGHLCLLAAFAAGLPELDDLDDDAGALAP